jgi:hypothetical protein
MNVSRSTRGFVNSNIQTINSDPKSKKYLKRDTSQNKPKIPRVSSSNQFSRPKSSSGAHLAPSAIGSVNNNQTNTINRVRP